MTRDSITGPLTRNMLVAVVSREAFSVIWPVMLLTSKYRELTSDLAMEYVTGS